MGLFRAIAGLGAAALILGGCGGPSTRAPKRSTTTTGPTTSIVQAQRPACTASQLAAMGGREGGGAQTAHGDVFLTTAGPKCLLSGVPTSVELLQTDGTVLNVNYVLITTPPAPQSISLSPGGTVDLSVSWSNWCGPNPGPLTVRITLPEGTGTISSPFNGPPDYNYLPGCIFPSSPSTLDFLGYTAAG